jgi:predicted DNA-binding transcriptional regulator
MSRDQTIGAAVLVICVAVILVYGWLIFLTGWSLQVLKLTGFIAVFSMLGIGAWIGWTLATTPPPKPIEEIEKEIEEEKLKEEEKPSETKNPEEAQKV